MIKIKIKADNKLKLSAPSCILLFLHQNKNLKEELQSVVTSYGLKATKIQQKNFTSDKGSEIRIYKEDSKPDLFIIKKIKTDENFSADYFRNYLAGLIPSLVTEEISILNVILPEFEPYKEYFTDAAYLAATIAEGAHYGAYSFDKYKTKDKEKHSLDVVIFTNELKKTAHVVETANKVMRGVEFTRNISNEPGMYLPPQKLAEQIKKECSGKKIKVTVFDEKEIKKRKMGGVLAVGSGSDNPPRFIVMEYKPKAAKKAKKIALVGKGVTFDSGGISLKPASDMWEMKADMSGAAVVAGIVLAAEACNLPVEITGIIPAVENMPSGKAYKPGDIVVTASGQTIEVDNTDAEGRVILADALYYASQLKPDAIIDLATLTGAICVALGEYFAGLFTNDDKMAEGLYRSGIKTNDRVWRMPLWNDYNKLIKSDVADVKNTGGRWGGAITAAKFLEMFVGKNIPWAHVDIAGPAIANGLNNYSKPYMTGFGVRLIFDYLQNI